MMNQLTHTRVEMYVENDKHESYGNSAIINLEEIDSDAIYI